MHACWRRICNSTTVGKPYPWTEKKKREGNTTGTIEGRLKKRVRICKKDRGWECFKKEKRKLGADEWIIRGLLCQT
jgi:hypothetical protein